MGNRNPAYRVRPEQVTAQFSRRLEQVVRDRQTVKLQVQIDIVQGGIAGTRLSTEENLMKEEKK